MTWFISALGQGCTQEALNVIDGEDYTTLLLVLITPLLLSLRIYFCLPIQENMPILTIYFPFYHNI